MFQTFRPALFLLLALTVLTGLLYPLAVTGLAIWLFPSQAHGSLIHSRGRLVGSELIGQPFEDPKHFWLRPSATAPGPYNAASSSGSNLGPLHEELRKAMEERRRRLGSGAPADLLTASASGLDPHISPEAAQFQAARVARARGMELARVQALVVQGTEGRQLGILGEPRVNVLRLNRILDEMK